MKLGEQMAVSDNRINKFLALSIFVEAVKAKGFSGAANRLDMSTSAITKSIAKLEASLGAQLFNRSTRRLVLTDSGKTFYDQSVAILRDLEQAEKSVRTISDEPAGRVKLHLPLSFGRVTVLPALHGLYEAYPDIVLDIHLADRRVNLLQEEFDLAVQVGDLADSSVVVRQLTRGPQVTVASPDYLSSHGSPREPSDLMMHRCIISRWGSNWNFRGKDGNPFQLAVPGAMFISSGDAVREATCLGLGISNGTWWLYRKDIAAGRLVPLLTEYETPGVPVSIIYPATRHLPARVRAVVDFLVRTIKLD